MTAQPKFAEPTQLVVGWKADINGNADYWSDPKKSPTPGSQQPSDLVLIEPASLASHAVIVAQSGSGKSYFLGRFLEEAILKTRGRVVILDPNGDFRRFPDVTEAAAWTKYVPTEAKPKYPHESSRDDFAPLWEAVNLAVYGGPQNRPKGSTLLQLPWATFPISFLSEGLEPLAQSQVYHCHEFVRAITALEMLKEGALFSTKRAKTSDSFLQRARTLLRRARSEGARSVLDEEFPKPAPRNLHMLQSEGWEWSHLPGSEALSHEVDGSQEWASRGAKDRASAAAEFVSPDIERFYFGRAKEYVAANLVKDSLRDVTEPPVGVQKGAVIDLPSFPDARTSRIVLSSIVDAVWRRARHDWAKAFDKSAKEDERVPVFLVIEEAHNIIPAEPQSSSAAALRDQIRTIAAEGRKYGVFLILVTQRPDKIDPLVVSECENRAVMRIAKSAEEITTKLLSLEQLGADMLSRLASLQQGRFVLVGPWASSSKSTIGLAAMRRTEEGGRSLRPEHWAQPEPIVPKPAKVSPKAPPAKTGKH